MTISTSNNQQAATDGALYRLVWRWHFYAGLLVAPFAIMLAFTGAIYLFEPQIDNLLYADVYNVKPAEISLSPDRQLTSVTKAFPDAHLLAYMPPASDDRSAIFRIKQVDGKQMLVGVNPHDGNVLGVIDENNRPMQFIRDLHGKLLSGTIGQGIVELAASWVMVLLVSGIYLWWPRGRGMLGALIPRLSKSGRILWRDLHAVTGLWISIFLVFLILTGLPWSLVAGKAINMLDTQFSSSPNTGLGWDGGGSQTVKSESSGQGWATDHAMHMTGAANAYVSHAGKDGSMSLEQVVNIAEKTLDIAKPYSIYFPIDGKGVYSVSSVQLSMPEATTYVHLDQYNGKVISDVRWADFGVLAKAISIGVSLHEGKYFGLPNQLLNLLVCCSLIGMICAGLVMWWKRRPPGSLGAPRKSSAHIGKGLVVLIVIMGVLMPLMGASILLILCGEWLVACMRRRNV